MPFDTIFNVVYWPGLVMAVIGLGGNVIVHIYKLKVVGGLGAAMVMMALVYGFELMRPA